MEGLGGWWCGRNGDAEKADMPSGWLAFATRRVDLMAACMRTLLALCGRHDPTKRGKNLTRWWFEFKVVSPARK